MVTLTPVENRNGIWYKREDLHRGAYGVNGSKLRACQHLMTQALLDGHTSVVSASSVRSPQAAMAGVVARELGMECEIIVGATTPEKAIRNHRSVEIASLCGANVRAIKVAYNPALQRAARETEELLGVWRLPYGITTNETASQEAVRAFLEVGAAQTQNLPDEIETLLIPFGSGNTGAGVLYGLHDARPRNLRRVVLFGIGPSRLSWVGERLLKFTGRELTPKGVELEHEPLHPGWAQYGDLMPETLDDIEFHPTYEGKIIRYLELMGPEYWTRRDGTTAFWIVGGPIG